MKKVSWACLISACGIALAACGGSTPDTGTPDGGSSPIDASMGNPNDGPPAPIDAAPPLADAVDGDADDAPTDTMTRDVAMGDVAAPDASDDGGPESGTATTICLPSQALCAPEGGPSYCATTDTDNANCGSCGITCPLDRVCSGGVCGLHCGVLAACMGDAGSPYCANTGTDNANCGACGNACGSGSVCQGGVCALTCGSLTTCTPDAGPAYCANTSADDANCGACGHVCGSGNVCAGSHCTLTCGSLTTCVPDGGAPYCASTGTDNANCGRCGNACPSGQVCAAGACGLTCGALTACGSDAGASYCANTQADQRNCGTCGHICPAGQACQSGSCSATCGSNEQVCSGACTNISYDPLNCGRCSTACTYAHGTGACSTGSCLLATCTSGYHDCDHLSANGCESAAATDHSNCGACGKVCSLAETCISGLCTLNPASGLLGYWPFEDAVGSTTASDKSGNNLSGTVVGAVAFVPGAGKRGTGAASFSGGYIDVRFPNDAAGDGVGASMPQGDITYAMWIKTSAAAVGGLQVVWGMTWGGGYDRIIGNGSPGPLNYNSWSEENMSGSATVNDGAWHQVVFVLDETNGFLAYVDGVLDAQDGNPTSNCGVGCSGFNWASDYLIGTGKTGRFNAGTFAGFIDDVRLYNFPLSSSDVTQLYNATK